MQRVAIGLLLVLHGLAHAGAGMWATGRAPTWFVTVLWGMAMVGFMAAGFGLLGVRALLRGWPWTMLVASASSLFLLAIVRHEAVLAGVVLDVAVVLLALRWAGPADAVAARLSRPRHRTVARAGRALAWTLLVYVTSLVVLRPWHTSWGSTRAERRTSFPGDPAGASYRVDHAITIRAPADSVWPWLVQIGQDRAGFYSYDWLERLIGDDIRNADRIVPEWQHLQQGDFVRAAQPGYLGGALGSDLGWRVSAIEPGRSVVLEGWGAFVLQPVDGRTTRLLVRTRGGGDPRLRDVALAPLSLLAFEPAHFIMERGMLRGIRDRAERGQRGAG
jgi:hypothetical protein